jgi:hypothetical protein
MFNNLLRKLLSKNIIVKKENKEKEAYTRCLIRLISELNENKVNIPIRIKEIGITINLTLKDSISLNKLGVLFIFNNIFSY